MSISYLKDIDISIYPVGTPERVIADAINSYNSALRGDFVPRDPTTGAPVDNTYSILNVENIFAQAIRSADFYYELSNSPTATTDITATITLPEGFFMYFARSNWTTDFSFVTRVNYSAFGIFRNLSQTSAVVTVGKPTYGLGFPNPSQISFNGNTFGTIGGVGQGFEGYEAGVSPALFTIFKL